VVWRRGRGKEVGGGGSDGCIGCGRWCGGGTFW
jgi:hypothetical protein